MCFPGASQDRDLGHEINHRDYRRFCPTPGQGGYDLVGEDTAGFGYRLRAGGNRSRDRSIPRPRENAQIEPGGVEAHPPSVARAWAKRALAAGPP